MKTKNKLTQKDLFDAGRACQQLARIHAKCIANKDGVEISLEEVSLTFAKMYRGALISVLEPDQLEMIKGELSGSQISEGPKITVVNYMIVVIQNFLRKAYELKNSIYGRSDKLRT